VRRIVTLAVICLSACGPAPVQPPADPSTDASYARSVQQLIALNRNAEGLFQKGNQDAASALILKGEPIATRLLAAPRPTVEAMEAASDLDQLYGRMLLANRNYGWARLQFQKNEARWKNWKPQTPETEKRLQAARAAIAECDRKMTE
jgi:hypothetical protein